jgi:hypothetical protein
MFIPPEYRNILSPEEPATHAESSIGELFAECFSCIPIWLCCSPRQEESGALFLIRKQQYRDGYLIALEYRDINDPIDASTIMARSDIISKDTYPAMFSAMCYEYGEPRIGSNWKSSDDKKIIDAFYDALSKLDN